MSEQERRFFFISRPPAAPTPDVRNGASVLFHAKAQRRKGAKDCSHSASLRLGVFALIGQAMLTARRDEFLSRNPGMDEGRKRTSFGFRSLRGEWARVAIACVHLIERVLAIARVFVIGRVLAIERVLAIGRAFVIERVLAIERVLRRSKV